MNIPSQGTVLFTIADKDKKEAVRLAQRFHRLGFHLLATSGTAVHLQQNQLPVTKVNKVNEGSPDILDLIRQGHVSFIINTLTKGKAPERDGFRIRREAVENGVVVVTSLDTAAAMLDVLESISFTALPMPTQNLTHGKGVTPVYAHQ